LHGALLAAADRVLRELDAEERARQRETQRQALAAGNTLAATAARRLRGATNAATRRITDAVTERPHRAGAPKTDARKPDRRTSV
jgi:hypothetical protein